MVRLVALARQCLQTVPVADRHRSLPIVDQPGALQLPGRRRDPGPAYAEHSWGADQMDKALSGIRVIDITRSFEP
jgi:hypothetical protein